MNNITKCNYCGKTEVCSGEYPEGCFLKHQLLKTKNDMEELKLKSEFLNK